ncbi:hypothetical protein MJO28_011075 [Puccinia striiformis f. sp. tritici]|uniref:Uncharacterized protein n=1 Tax=Puccinia striiformis f. sp. tritici TaxID=168172 RepID=A0ACC0E1L1_9BASI|nr:hypothetical protein MJO28_011075 [Puccinia striiformis f. sp. tritici]
MGEPSGQSDLSKTIAYEGYQEQQERLDQMEEAMEKERSEMDKERWEMNERIKKMEEMMERMAGSGKKAEPQDVPIPETPQPQTRFASHTPYTEPVRSNNRSQARFETSTPFTHAPATPNPQTGYRTSTSYNLDRSRTRPGYSSRMTSQETPVASPADHHSFEKEEEIQLPKEGTLKGYLDTKKTTVSFDGTEVEDFIKRIQRMAKLQDCGSKNLALQLPFIIPNQKTSRAMELMEGHKIGNWDLLKKEMIRKWGRATPHRRFTEESIPQLVKKNQEAGGIKSKQEYQKFTGDYEEMIEYFIRMEYPNIQDDNGEILWKALSADLKREVRKELAHDGKLKKTKDGRPITPDLITLKYYVELALDLDDFEEVEEVVTKPPSKKSVAIKDPKEEDPRIAQLEEQVKKLTEAQKSIPPHFGRSASPDPRGKYSTPMECFYCRGKHSVWVCEYWKEDSENNHVRKIAGVYYYPNGSPIMATKDDSVRTLVHRHLEDQRKLSGPVSNPSPDKAVQEPKVSVVELEEWGSWIPPQVPGNQEEFMQTNIGFGLRKSQRVQDKQASPTNQSEPNKTQTPPLNQEGNKTRARRKSVPGSWDDEDVEEEESVETPKSQSTVPVKKKNPVVKSKGDEEPSCKLNESIRKKFYKQTYTLSLEEILKFAPKFLQHLQDSQGEEERSVSMGRIRTGIPEDFPETGDDESTGLNYTCPVGMVDMTIGKRKIRTLVDTGAEMNIITESLANQLGLVTTEIFMRLRGIGGHYTPIVGLAENIKVTVFPGYSHLANFFIVRGSVHTVLGRPFLADHNIRLELSNTKGEVLSFEDTEGKRLCIPICLPDNPGWHKEPPRLRQNCSFQLHGDYMDQNIQAEVTMEPVEDESNSSSEAPVISPTLDPWIAYMAEPVNWAEELGGSSFTVWEWERIQRQEEFDQALWDAPPINNTSWRRMTHRKPAVMFCRVFDESKRPKKLRKGHEWLKELPGGLTHCLDFLVLLNKVTELSFVKNGNWVSKYGNRQGYVNPRMRQKLYDGDGKKWFKKHVRKGAEDQWHRALVVGSQK